MQNNVKFITNDYETVIQHENNKSKNVDESRFIFEKKKIEQSTHID